MKEHLDIKIYGKVQGVFFRVSAKQKADELGLFGFAKNESDGSVYIQAEGGEHLLRIFLDWCRQGPSDARVDRLEFEKGELQNYQDFQIL